jgi:hypothetical protein
MSYWPSAVAGLPSQGLPNRQSYGLNREFVSKAMNYVRPDRTWRLLRRSAEREHSKYAAATLDTLRARGVQTLLLWGAGEPTYDEMAPEPTRRASPVAERDRRADSFP